MIRSNFGDLRNDRPTALERGEAINILISILLPLLCLAAAIYCLWKVKGIGGFALGMFALLFFCVLAVKAFFVIVFSMGTD